MTASRTTPPESSRIAAMLADLALGGDLLLVGLAFAHHLDGPDSDQPLAIGRVARQLWPGRPYRKYHVQRLLGDDARTYRAPQPRPATCTSPMIRRAGLCGQPGKHRDWLTDWRDGQQELIAACARHRGWWERQVAANKAARPSRVPLPAANHGGVLARHLPELDWRVIWMWATDSRWVEHPEAEPWVPLTFALVLGDGEGNPAGASAGTRPVLAVVPR